MQNEPLRSVLVDQQLRIYTNHEILANAKHQMLVNHRRKRVLLNLSGKWAVNISRPALYIIHAFLEPADEWEPYPAMYATCGDALLPHDPLHFMNEEFGLWYIHVPDHQERLRLRVLEETFSILTQQLDKRVRAMSDALSLADFKLGLLRYRVLGVLT